MAGTGHPWDVANPSEARAAAAGLASLVPEGPGRAWFGGKAFLKHITSERFCVKLDARSGTASAEGFDAEERDLLLAKVKNGGDVRLFSRPLLNTAGASFEHVADWIGWLSSNDGTTYGKLRKMSVADAVRKADAWTVRLMAAPVTGPGCERERLRTSSGRRWVELEDTSALHAEGSAMKHCVGGYSLDSGYRTIMSLRDARGRPAVTVEFRVMKDGWKLVQARGFANSPVPGHAQADLAELMDFIGAAGGGAAVAAGICRDEGGRWRRMIDVWERISWNGFDGVRSGRDMLVLSPVNPALALVRISFMGDGDVNLPAAPGETKAVVTSVEERHFHIDEIRAVARIRNLVGDLSSCNGTIKLACVDGQVVALRDTWEARLVHGAEMLVEKVDGGEILHVVHRRDRARTLLMIGEGRFLRGAGQWMSTSVVAVPVDQHRWSESDALRCAAAMTAGNAITLVHPDLGLRSDRFGLTRVAGSQWRAFELEAERSSALTCVGEWAWTSYAAKLRVRGEGGAYLTFDREGRAKGIDSISTNAKHLQEIAAWLNSRGITPSNRAYGFSEIGDGSRLLYPAAGRLFWFRGEWVLTDGPEQMLQMAWRARGRRSAPRLDPAEAESLLSAFPQHLSGIPEAHRPMLAEALASWSRNARKDKERLAFHWRGWPAPAKEAAWQQTTDGRLAAAFSVIDLFSEQERKRLGTLAAHVAREALRIRAARFNDPSRPVLERILSNWHASLPDALFIRCIKRFCRNEGLVADGKPAPDPAWFGTLLERSSKVRGRDGYTPEWMVRQAAERSFWRLRDPEHCRMLQLRDGRSWVACLRLASAGRTYTLHLSADRLVACLKAAAQADGPEWSALLAEARTLSAEIHAKECPDKLAA